VRRRRLTRRERYRGGVVLERRWDDHDELDHDPGSLGVDDHRVDDDVDHHRYHR
jgi:hypothetical protein